MKKIQACTPKTKTTQIGIYGIIQRHVGKVVQNTCLDLLLINVLKCGMQLINGLQNTDIT